MDQILVWNFQSPNSNFRNWNLTIGNSNIEPLEFQFGIWRFENPNRKFRIPNFKFPNPKFGNPNSNFQFQFGGVLISPVGIVRAVARPGEARGLPGEVEAGDLPSLEEEEPLLEEWKFFSSSPTPRSEKQEEPAAPQPRYRAMPANAQEGPEVHHPIKNRGAGAWEAGKERATSVEEGKG